MVSMLQKWLHRLFDLSILFKGIDGLLEVMGGIALMVLRPEQIGWITMFLTKHELAEDSRDILANVLLHIGTSITPHGQIVSVLFLLSHGFIKIFLVWELFRGRLWAYPLTIAVLLLFIAYQTVDVLQHHSLLLASLTVLDVFIVLLAWWEYQQKRHALLHSL